MSDQPPRPRSSKVPAATITGRCTHYNLWDLTNVGARCVMGRNAEGHDMAATTGNALGLPIPIHRDSDGNEWTSRGPFKREVRPDATT